MFICPALAVHCSYVQYSTLLYCTVPYCSVQFNEVRCISIIPMYVSSCSHNIRATYCLDLILNVLEIINKYNQTWKNLKHQKQL